MSPPSTIAHYRIVSKLGEGGMGAVYRATDTKLNRDVAVKVLPDSFAADPDRLARFTREAQVLASLNHPNIAAIYGVEDRALIMELVEGADLAGPLAEEQALPLVHQLIDALECLGITLYVKDAANGAPERKLLQSSAIKYVSDWSRDGRFLLFSELSVKTGKSGLWAFPDPLGSGDPKPIPLGDDRFNESQPSASPDSRWVAYISNETGANEIYVRPFPPGDGRSGRWRVSSSGGSEPRWRADGKELYYRAADGKLMAVDVTAAPGAAVFQSGIPHPLFATRLEALVSTFNYEAARDGKRFLLALPSADNTATPITLVLNWESALRK